MCRGIRVGDKLGDPPSDLGHRRGFGAAGCSAVEEGWVPTRGGARAGEEVAGFRLQVHGLTEAEDGTDAEVGVTETTRDEICAVKQPGWVRRGRRVGECP